MKTIIQITLTNMPLLLCVFYFNNYFNFKIWVSYFEFELYCYSGNKKDNLIFFFFEGKDKFDLN